ncbi:hypothetical protein SY89_02601 [Halolamina pelagica]|uniref:Uncharacterized protein n=1 Tax=Halolamina pelagica TaxID=699431 RepID=A0A0P7GCV5_9EURY|nr:hypothetical protein SY89_02601 [Halolamina pelagica]
MAVNLLEEKIESEVEGEGTRTWERGAIEQQLGERMSLDNE